MIFWQEYLDNFKSPSSQDTAFVDTDNSYLCGFIFS